MPQLRLLRWLSALISVLWISSAVGQQSFPNPRVEGPIPFQLPASGDDHNYPFYSQADWLAPHDYVEQEFFVHGTANRYDMDAGRIAESGLPYSTRMVVRRPADAADFNGTVLLEWQNVTAGYDLDALWSSFREHFVDAGYIWVGISAQRVGVNHLREWSPVRYGQLDVTAGGSVERDAISFDIFGQAAQSIRSPTGVNPLAGFEVQEIIGKGASQSASYLTPFYNSVQPQYAKVIDLLFLAVGGGDTRDDSDIPVFRILSETDVLGGARRGAAARENSEQERIWEMAGTSHSSYEGFVGRLEVFERDQGSPAVMPDCNDTPYTRVPASRIYQAAYAHMVNWIREGTLPPVAPPLTRYGNELARDVHGNALGGVRLAEHEVATALNTGANSGSGFCRLYGSWEPFSKEKLDALYPSHEDYVQRVRMITENNVRAGFVLPADGEATLAAARESGIGR